MRRLLLAAVAVAALFSAGCTAAPAQNPSQFQIFAVSDRKPAPQFKGDLLDGSGTWDLAAHPNTVVVVNFWASWCGPCVGEAPELETVYQDVKANGVVFVGIDVRDETDAARAFATQHSTYPSIVDPASKLALGFAVAPNAVPATIIIDRQGRIAAIARAGLVRTELEPVVTQVARESA